MNVDVLYFFVFKILNKDFIYLYLERGGGRKKERERKHQCVVSPYMAPTGGPGLQARHVP